ncbi:MAG: VacB/RNase II family 3'-5' exoribonuclease, partial [Deltaproteobacteria bacterium]|nr:VacB/RNase II family 3'-5' exoribonuclease [Deltaproteobacteria bacterium]
MKKKSASPKKKRLQIGELHLHRDGYGFVIAATKNERDVFIPAPYIGDAMHSDIVEAEVIDRAAKSEGRILRIVERRLETLFCRIEQAGKGYKAIAEDSRIRRQILIPPEHVNGAQHGQNAIIRILRYPRGAEPMMGKVEALAGKRGDVQTELKTVMVRHQLPLAFPHPVLDAAKRINMSEDDLTSREDLRHIPFVTIDGETAQDFDDAVAAERLSPKLIRLWVSIADVSHFVMPGTPLDVEALKRGTSVYFPGKCLSMLPEKLSNDLCSLRPHEDRLTMTAMLDIDHHGLIQHKKFFVSVIKSRRRMTYTEMKQCIDGDISPDVRRDASLMDSFDAMMHCFQWLRAMRKQRGSIDFDLPEPQILIDLQGGIEAIVKAERHEAHMLIEEFMIAANEAVAEHLTEQKMGCIYRIHDAPEKEKLHDFFMLLHNLGHRVQPGKKIVPKKLAEIVTSMRGLPEERLVNHQLLRSMAKAVYHPDNIGHFGLASTCYCHFTSPIRRYPDLVIHRLLKQTLKSGKKRKPVSLQEISDQCTR